MPPPNDNFASAEVLAVGGGSFSDDTTGCTAEAPFAQPDVWFTFTPASSGLYTFSVDWGTIVDPELAFYTGAAIGSLTGYFFTGTLCQAGAGKAVNVELVGGITYRIRLIADTSDGTYTLNWAAYTAPATGPSHDNINDALVLAYDGATHTVSLDTSGATFETNEAADGEGEPGIWLTVDVSAAAGLVDVTLDMSATGFNPFADLWSVLDGTFSPTLPDWNHLTYEPGGSLWPGDETTHPAAATVTLNPADSFNGVFYIFLGDWDFTGFPCFASPAEGAITVIYTVADAGTSHDANETCATATVLTGVSGSFTFSNLSGTQTWQSPDPLFTWAGEGGGSPRWYVIANPFARKAYLRVFLTAGPTSSMPKVNAAILRGPGCGSLAVDTNDDDTLTTFAVDNQTPSPTREIAQLADSLETLWIEIDGWSGDVSDPPTLTTPERGELTVNWEWVDAVLYDRLGDYETILAAVDDPLIDSSKVISSLVYARGRLWLAWRRNDTPGDNLVGVASCNLDGSDLQSAIFDPGITPQRFSTDIGGEPVLTTDGENVWIGFYHCEIIDQRVFGCLSCSGGIFDPGTTHWLRIWCCSGTATNTWTQVEDLLVAFDPIATTLRISSDPAVAGTCWWYAAGRDDHRYWGCNSDTPPHCVLQATVYEEIAFCGSVSATGRVDLNVGIPPYATLGDDYVYTPTLDLVTDVGYPVLVLAPREPGDAPLGDWHHDGTLRVYRLDTGSGPLTELNSMTIGDLSASLPGDANFAVDTAIGDLGPIAPDLPRVMRLHDRYYNIDAARYERPLTFFCFSPGTPADPSLGVRVVIVPDDLLSAPSPLDGDDTHGLIFNTTTLGYGVTGFVRDGTRNLFAFTANGFAFQRSYRCAFSLPWAEVLFDTQHDPWQDPSRVYFNPDEPAIYYGGRSTSGGVKANLEKRPIDRNALICSVGDIPISPEVVGIRTTHRMIGVT